MFGALSPPPGVPLLARSKMHSPADSVAPTCVLVVDRHADTRSLYAQYLKLEGFDVDEAEDGREALAKALTRRYDAIVTETRLSGIDGYQLCDLLRRDSATAATPLVVVTGDVMTADLDRVRAAGATAVLIKPCLPETLFAELRRVLAGERASQPGDGGVRVLPTDDRPAVPGSRRSILSRSHRRGDTTSPPTNPPTLLCPLCDRSLGYQRSYVGGVSARHAEQWDYFKCPADCGTFEYRHRTRKLRKVRDEDSRAVTPGSLESRARASGE